jgi:hypothetical protein
MFPQDEDPRSSASFCLSTNPAAAAICHHCEKDKQNKQRRSRSSYPFRSQSQTPLSLYNLPPYTPAIVAGLYQDQRPVLWLVIWNVGGAEVWRQTPEQQGGDVRSSVRTSRRFEYSVVVASIQREDESPRDYERMFRPPLRPTKRFPIVLSERNIFGFSQVEDTVVVVQLVVSAVGIVSWGRCSRVGVFNLSNYV